MGLFELVVFFFVKPLSLTKAAVLLGARIFLLVTLIWLQLAKSFINFLADLCWKFVTWSVACMTLPIRILTAVHRERMLEMSLLNKRVQLDDLIWERTELEEKLRAAVKERKVMETVFAELEYDYEKVLSRMEELEKKLQELKDENLRLTEVQGKIRWNHESDKDDQEVHAGIPVSAKYGLSPWNSTYDESGMTLEKISNHKDTWSDATKGTHYHQDVMKSGSDDVDALYLRRTSAISQSLFSAILSLLVGAIIWEAEDPCMPLVAALFIVVGMSLSSVVQFFSTIKNKPASDAVALLSFNWFILGTLSSPTLPRVARVLAPPTLKLVGRVLG